MMQMIFACEANWDAEHAPLLLYIHCVCCADDADCTKEWSEEENDFQEPSAAPCSKAKAVKPKPKAKRKLQTKPAAKKK